MKQGKSLVELAAEIQRQAETKKDFVAPVREIGLAVSDAGVQMVLGGGNYPLTAGGFNNTKVVPLHPDKAFGLTNLAHGQLAEYADIPKAYYDRCLTQEPDLLALNVNRWLAGISAKATKEARMVRVLDGQVRAVLSDRYRALENADLAESVLPVLLEQELEILSCEITQRKLYIKAVDRRINRDIPRGKKMGDGSHEIFDTVSPAIVISNSEVGCGALSIETAVYTRACTNMAIFGQRSLRKYHTGARSAISDDVYAMLTDKTKRVTDAAVWMQVRDIVKGAFDQVKFDASLQDLRDAAEQPIEGNVVEVVEVTRRKMGFTKTEGESILKHLIEGADLSRYGMMNAITRAAEDLPDYDRATEFERAGGQLIELPRHDWEEIAKAA